ncbi:MAG: RICIN domain-containing protein [Methylophaga sp.]|nr:RICIN domain-containing protein [Methylophaga sp.]
MNNKIIAIASLTKKLKISGKWMLFCCSLMQMNVAMAASTVKGPTPPEGLYTIQQQSTGRYMNAYTTKNKDFSAFTDTLKIANEQMWYLKYISKNTYTIRQQGGTQYLDAHTDAGHDFNVVTRPHQKNNSQKWIIKKIGNDLYTIQQKSNMQYLDAHDAGGAFSVVTRPAQNNNSQRWIIKRTSKVPVKVTIDLNLYCKKNFGSKSKAVLNGKTALDWVCQTNEGINARKACQQQHGTKQTGYTEKSNPYSWYCVK